MDELAGIFPVPTEQQIGEEQLVPVETRLVLQGLEIVLDAEKGTLDVELSQAELDKRKAAWKPRPNPFQNGDLWKDANEVGAARTGAVTHPGARAETHTYADI